MPHKWIKTASDWLFEPFVLFILGAVAYCVGYVSYYDFGLASLFGFFDLLMVDIAGLFNVMASLYFFLFIFALRNHDKTVYERINISEKFFRNIHFESLLFSLAFMFFTFILFAVVVFIDVSNRLYLLVSYLSMFLLFSCPLIYFARALSFIGNVGRKITLTLYIRCIFIPLFAGWFSIIGATKAAWNDLSRSERIIITMSSGSLFGRMPIYTQKGVVILAGETAREYSFIPFDSIQRIDRYSAVTR
ncbi:hypothetical protein ACJ4V0_11490 [Phreatobacter sp. HK31-P]